MLTMTKFITTIAAVLLATVIATPVFAQGAVQEPGAYAFYHPNADVLGGRPAFRSYEAMNAFAGDIRPRVTQSWRKPVARHHRR
jgi:hypothetical protein